MVVLTQEQLERLKNASYKIIGKYKHSAVKLCTWLKKCIRTGGKEFCYKQKFYGIATHRCLQLTPALPFCTLSCLFCWRDTRINYPEWKNGFDSPEEIVELAIKAQRELLTGLGGIEHSKKHLEEAFEPKHAAISLDGEPTLYPKISELIEEFHKRNFTTFLVTNGTTPEVLEKITLPTQLYVSMSSCDEEMFKKINRPLKPGLWERYLKTLELFHSLTTRKVIRMTLYKLNAVNPEKYAKLIIKAEPDFIEIKAAMSVGYARIQNRFKYEDMLRHEEIKQFAEKISELTGYPIKDEKKDSRVVLLSKKNNTKLIH
ncbi:MAG TPA: 4-demethylwyosine synthase TYW1 [Nanoarchaeota archaeon]|nr:4-demethylwyosine synthase TYW1 [Nanoarchaeota archaeon]